MVESGKSIKGLLWSSGHTVITSGDCSEAETQGVDQWFRASVECMGPWDLFPKVEMGKVVCK